MAQAKKRKNPRLGRERPPNLRQTGQQEHRACSGCEHFMGSYCQRFQWPVRPFHVCDAWAEKTPDLSDKQARLGRGMEVTTRNVTISVDPGGAGA